MKYRALVPVKTLDKAKSRLATHLTPMQRATLTLKMLEHVLIILDESRVFERVSVVSSDPQVIENAKAHGARIYGEAIQGHNPALYAAATQELANGTEVLLTISADLPLLKHLDIINMVELSEKYDIVLASSLDGTGTNALVVNPPLGVPYVFGLGSLQRYQEEAQQHHLSSTIYHSPGLSLDIDTIDDLERLHRYEQEKKALRVS